MPVDLFSVLLAIPRNPVTAVGVPFVFGMLSGSPTKNIIRGQWYNVSSSTETTLIICSLTPVRITEPILPTWKTTSPGFPHRLVYPLHWSGNLVFSIFTRF